MKEKETKNKSISNMSLIKTMRKTIAHHNLISNGDKIVVGVSGGADSVSLLRALHALQSNYNLNLIVCHVNHKIRPGAAEEDQKFVETLCESLSIPFYVKEAPVEELAKEWNMSAEEAGRKVRYDFFNEIAGEDGKIATAHNKNDNAETVMMRFMRGTGLQGLTGIPYRRDNIIRPLLDISRDEIEEFLKEIVQDYVTDGSNLEQIYTRNKIRLDLIPTIQEKFNPNFVETVTRNIQGYTEDNDFMRQCTKKAIDEYFNFSDNHLTISKSILENEHIAIIKRAVLVSVKDSLNIDLSSKLVNSIIDMLNKKGKAEISVAQDIVAESFHDEVVIGERIKREDNKKDDSEIRVAMCEDSLMEIGNMKIKLSEVQASNVENNERVFYLPAKKLTVDTMFRTRREGDIVALCDGMSKKLKKFFIDQKIPAEERDDKWLLVSDGKVIWIPGLFGGRLNESERSGKFFKFEVVCN